MKLKSIMALVLTVLLLTAGASAGENDGNPPIPVGGWAALRARVEYPEMALKAGIEGEVLMHVYIDKNGRAVKMKVVKGSRGIGFVDAVYTALRETPFEPGQRYSIPVGMWTAVRVVFSIYG